MGPSVLLKSPWFVITLLLYLSSVAYSKRIHRNNSRLPSSFKEVASDQFALFSGILLTFATLFSVQPPPETIKFIREFVEKAAQYPELYPLYAAVAFCGQGLILSMWEKRSTYAWAIAAYVMAALCPPPVNFAFECIFYGLLVFFVGIMVLKACVYMDVCRFSGPSKLSRVLEIGSTWIEPAVLMLIWISAPSFPLPSFEMPGRIGELILGYAKRVSQDRELYPLLTVVIGVCIGLLSGNAWMFAAFNVALFCPPPINTVSSCIYYGALLFFTLMTLIIPVLLECKHSNQLKLYMSFAFIQCAITLVGSFILSIVSSRSGLAGHFINYESSKPSV